MMLGNQQPLNPQQLAQLQRRIGAAESQIYGGAMPQNMGQGLQQLGTAIGLAAMRRRYDSQFPEAPGGAQQQTSPLQSILQSLSSNRGQFPSAPPPPVHANTPQMGALAQTGAGGGSLFQRMGGILGLGGLFGPKAGGGLY